MKNRRMILSILLSILIVLLACACSDNTGGNKKPSTAVTATRYSKCEYDTKSGTAVISGNGPMKINADDFSKWDDNIRRIIIKKGVTDVEAGVFHAGINGNTGEPTWCTQYVKEVKLPDTIKKIGNSAFWNCISLKIINIPAGVSSIEDGAFELCGSLKEFTFPDKIVKVNSRVLSECAALERVNIGDNTVTISFYAFAGCKKLKHIKFPKSLKKIDDMAFYACPEIEKVNLPEKLETIGHDAFGQCTFTTVTIPKSVKKIGEKAFGYFNGKRIKGFTIKGYKGSAAEKYAKDNKFEFKALG